MILRAKYCSGTEVIYSAHTSSLAFVFTCTGKLTLRDFFNCWWKVPFFSHSNASKWLFTLVEFNKCLGGTSLSDKSLTCSWMENSKLPHFTYPLAGVPSYFPQFVSVELMHFLQVLLWNCLLGPGLCLQTQWAEDSLLHCLQTLGLLVIMGRMRPALPCAGEEQQHAANESVPHLGSEHGESAR